MNPIYPQPRRLIRLVALLLTALLTLPLFTACGGTSSTVAPPPVDNTLTGTQAYPTNQPQAKRGLGTGQKVALLAGAAALYYLYNQHKNSQEQGPQGQYYLSKNGRVYYRDAEHRAHWVTPPPEGIRVSEPEAQQYRDFQGYNNSPTGRDLTELQPAPVQ